MTQISGCSMGDVWIAHSELENMENGVVENFEFLLKICKTRHALFICCLQLLLLPLLRLFNE